MDKKEGGSMMRKGIAVFVLAVFLALSAGCETAKGFGEGISKDTSNAWRALKKADAWMKKNLW